VTDAAAFDGVAAGREATLSKRFQKALVALRRPESDDAVRRQGLSGRCQSFPSIQAVIGLEARRLRAVVDVEEDAVPQTAALDRSDPVSLLCPVDAAFIKNLSQDRSSPTALTIR
jgi:hypothetical protein